VTEINFNPTGDSIVRLTKFEFYERSPNMYNWVNGGSGPNNYPQFYGIRVLRDGLEIYRMEHIATHLNWTLQTFDFSSIPEFDIDQPAIIRIEILPYCPIGNGATVSAWDIDEVNLFGGCLPSTDNSPLITGTIKTESGKEVPGATISLGKYASFIPAQHATSNSDGAYFFNAVDKGWKYYIKGSKNDNWLQGVNTMDLLRLQKHLLGIERFTSITQYVASDINHNGIINVTDLLDLRKALLGIYSSFPYNTSWRLGTRNDLPISSFTEFDVVNKLPPAIPQSLLFDFLGVKVGDVNQDIDLDIQPHDLISRSSDAFDLKVDEMAFQDGIEITVPIIAGGDIQMEGLQLMMSSHQMQLLSIQPGKIPMQPEFYFYSSPGILSFSWSQVESISISKGDVLFTIILSAQNPGVLSQEINLMHTTLLPEVYAQGETKSVNLSFEYSPTEKQGERISQVSIEPNPFTETSTIHFHLKELSKVRFVFYDLTGQMLYEEEHEFSPGMQSLMIDNSKLRDREGLIYCQMMTDDQVITEKLVKIR